MGEPQVEIARDEVGDATQRYRSAVSAYFARRISNRADVDDLTQEVFANLLRRSQLETVENIEGYIFQIAANVLRERFRRAGRRIDIHPEALEENSPHYVEEISPERILIGKETHGRFVQALQELPERTRTIFVLNRFEELSAREIANRMGLSVSTIEKEMMRAIAHLRERVR
jgi:RNA polymerase sigma-70 factor (ECF subfamily)